MLLGFYSIIFSCRRLYRPGVSLEVRKLFIFKHTFYVFALIFLWLLQMLINYYELFRPDFKVETPVALQVNETIQIISFVAMFSTGMVMAIIRGLDPFFRFLIKQKFWQIFGVLIEEPQAGIKAEVLSTFLASSLNIELVYIILAGITRFSNS